MKWSGIYLLIKSSYCTWINMQKKFFGWDFFFLFRPFKFFPRIGKDQPAVHIRIRFFNIVRKTYVTHKKCSCLLLRSENNYWDAGKSTDPRWHLHFAEKIKMVETDQKKIPSQKCFLHVYIGTMIQLFKKKKNPAHSLKNYMMRKKINL